MLDEEQLQSDRIGKHEPWGLHAVACYVPFLGRVWCIQSIVLTGKDGSAVTTW